jgi:hypothetical protein
LQAKLAAAEGLAAERKEAFERERERANALNLDLIAARELAATVDPLKGTIEALKSALEAERRRSFELSDNRDRWYVMATERRSWFPWRRRA